MSKTTIRLNTFLSQTLFISRRKAEELILKKEILINSQRISSLSTQVCPKTDIVKYKKKVLRLDRKKIYIAFNKPPQVLTTMKDDLERPCVADFFKVLKKRVFPVGRLDWSTEGLLLMTNDGTFSQEVMHPKFEIDKTYLVKINKPLSQVHKKKLLTGVPTPIGKLQAKKVFHVVRTSRRLQKTKHQWIKIIVHEGRNRMIRRMLEKLGYDVKTLRRVAIGNLKMSKLSRGHFEFLSPQQIQKIFQKSSFSKNFK